VAAMLWILPIAHGALSIAVPKHPVPMYSRAIAKMKFGKYDEAEWEVIHELEKCDDDFEGWLMLAELYANHFRDMAEADRTIRETCGQPNVTGSQVAVAMHRLADWYLKLADDPTGARRALEEICQRMPGTHLDKMARQRINRLPATREELREQRKGRTIRLPALGDSLDQAAGSSEPTLSQAQTVAQANKWVEKLKQDPDNVPAREELARLFAEHLDQLDLAIEQLNLLMEMPGQPEHKITEWLSLLAAWQIKNRRDLGAARILLERLVRDYPQSPQAFAAQRRINLMDAELKFRQARAGPAGRDADHSRKSV
jgi:hypothetical protein